MTDLTAPMSPDDVKAARLELGFAHQLDLANALGLEGKYRHDTVRSWENGRVGITGPARVAIRLLLERHRAA
jgi:DNA-binding transcriptional regulator YiaG